MLILNVCLLAVVWCGFILRLLCVNMLVGLLVLVVGFCLDCFAGLYSV